MKNTVHEAKYYKMKTKEDNEQKGKKPDMFARLFL